MCAASLGFNPDFPQATTTALFPEAAHDGKDLGCMQLEGEALNSSVHLTTETSAACILPTSPVAGWSAQRQRARSQGACQGVHGETCSRESESNVGKRLCVDVLCCCHPACIGQGGCSSDYGLLGEG